MNAVETVTKHNTSPGLLGRIETGLGQIGKSPPGGAAQGWLTGCLAILTLALNGDKAV